MAVQFGAWDPPDWLPNLLLVAAIVCGILWLIHWTPRAFARLRAIGSQGWKRIGVTALITGFLFALLTTLFYWDAAMDYRASRDRANSDLAEERAKVVAAEAKVDLVERQMEALREKADILTASLVKALGDQQAQATIASAPPLPLGPTKLRTEIGVTMEDYPTVVEALRSEFGLRPITFEELGRPLGEMPIQSYYFVYMGYLSLQRESAWSGRERKAPTGRENENAIEMHTTLDGQTHIIAFVDEASATRITTLDGQTEQTVDVYSRPYSARTVLALIPTERLVAASNRTADRLVATLTVH
jgi:hypothetical protein